MNASLDSIVNKDGIEGSAPPDDRRGCQVPLDVAPTL